MKRTTPGFTIKKNKSEQQFETVKICNSQNCYDYIKQFYGDDLEVWESFFILLLNRNNHTIGYAKISQGGIAGTIVDVKIIAKYCIDSLASACVLAHNHPSGNLQPSQADKDITQKVKKALELLEVTVLDHVILTTEGYYSFADNGIL
jgi:DNA repair protein RadC